MFGDTVGLGNYFDPNDLSQQQPGLSGGYAVAGQPQQDQTAAPPQQVADATPASKPADTGDLHAFLRATNQKYGLPDNYLSRTAKIESSFNPRDVSSTGAAGLFQFTKGTAARVGLSDRFDPVASTDAAARLALENKSALAKNLGRDPTGGELYLAHQQGAAGASALLANPDKNVVDALSTAYGGNRAAARRAVTVNGGSADMTAGQFANRWTSKFDGTTTAVASNSNRMSDNDYRRAFPDAPRLDTGRVNVAENAPQNTPSSPTNVAAAGEGLTPGLSGKRPFVNPFAGIKAPEITVMPLTRGPAAKVPQIVPIRVAETDPLPLYDWQA